MGLAAGLGFGWDDPDIEAVFLGGILDQGGGDDFESDESLLRVVAKGKDSPRVCS